MDFEAAKNQNYQEVVARSAMLAQSSETLRLHLQHLQNNLQQVFT
jgi:hypothetical protein